MAAAAGGDMERLRAQVERMGVRSPPVRLAQKVPAGTRTGETLDIVTNVWGMIPGKNIPIYRYDFRVLEEYPPKKGASVPAMKEVTKQTRDDYLAVDRKNKCVAVYQTLLRREKQFFGPMDSLVYDRAATLYSLRQLPIRSVGGDRDPQASFFLMPNELPNNTVGADCLRVHVNVKSCKDDFQLTMNDLRSAVSDNPDEINRSLQQFLELLAAQEAFFTEGRFVSYGTGQCYLMDPNQFGFNERDMPELQEGKYVGVGASKGVKVIEGPQGAGGINAAMVIDVKKAAFHIDNQELVEKVESILRKSRVEISRGIDQQSVAVLTKGLKGIHVRCNYGKRRTFAIAGISRDTPRSMKLATSSGEISVEDYFRKKYSINLRHPNLPLIIERSQPKNNFYPMEVLAVCENQRVSQAQQTSNQVQSMIRACATLPAQRMRQTIAMTRAMKLDNSAGNRWLKGCNVTVASNLVFTARVLPVPQIEYHTNGYVCPNEKTAWVAGKNHYLLPATCENWCAFALVGPREGRFNENQFRAYIRVFLSQCHQRGMRIGDPLGIEYIRRAKQQDIETLISKAKQMGATFIHFITADELSYHGHLKYIEAQEQVLTQDLKASTALAAPQKWQTLDNIVNKTNIKLGGINYAVHLEKSCDGWLMKDGRLVVGLDIAHPPVAIVRGKDRSIVPSVVGYSANVRKHPMDFIGGYRYGRADMEELSDNSIQQIFSDLLRYFNASRGKPPNHLFVVRDGVSEGQYKYIVNTEVEQIKKACQAVGGPNFRPHITFIVLTKMHSIRLYRKNIQQQAKAAEQNIKPGTVIDKHIVSPVLSEFYLNAHSAFQGTTKTPRYTLLFDTSKMSADEMQGIVHALAYDFQIVNMAVSRPSPVMIASRMAQRGRSNYIAMYGDESENSDNGGGVEKDLARLNQQLSYISKPLESVRFNA